MLILGDCRTQGRQTGAPELGWICLVQGVDEEDEAIATDAGGLAGGFHGTKESISTYRGQSQLVAD